MLGFRARASAHTLHAPPPKPLILQGIQLQSDPVQHCAPVCLQEFPEPNQKLVDVLKAWSLAGVDGVRQMYRYGLAPAVLGAFGAQQAFSPDERVL